MGKILSRLIHHTVLPEAILAIQALVLFKRSATPEIDTAQLLCQRVPAPIRCSMFDGILLEGSHAIVTDFAGRFAQAALENEPRLRSAGLQLTSTELHRFQRAFYRFDLYCRTANGVPPADPEELQNRFFKHYSACELEQIACVRDFLIREIAKRKTSLSLKSFHYCLAANIRLSIQLSCGPRCYLGVFWGPLHQPTFFRYRKRNCEQGFTLCLGVMCILWLREVACYAKLSGRWTILSW